MNNQNYRDKYNELKNSLDISEFFNYYSWHSVKDTSEKFHCNQYDIERLCQENNYIKDKVQERYLKLVNSKNIDVSELLSYYKNNSVKLTADKFGLQIPSLKFILSYNNITPRSKIEEQKLTNKALYGDENFNNIKQAVINRESKYGSHEEYNKHFRETYINNRKDKFGSWETYVNLHSAKVHETTQNRSDEERELVGANISQGLKLRSTNQNQEAAAKRKDTCIENYGSYDNYLSHMLEQVQTTNLNKYGVPWACLRPEAKVKGNNSKPNQAFAALLEQYNIKYTREFVISDKSFDFKINNTLIEINPTATHNSTWSVFKGDVKSATYHQEKTQLAIANNYDCLHIWDWDDADKIAQRFLIEERVSARNCEIHEVSKLDTKEFLNTNHLQGSCNRQEIRLGLYINGTLIELMTFGKPRYNKNYQYELLRLCTKLNYIVIGGAERLYKYFLNNYMPDSIISYCDNAKFQGGVYNRLGMILKTYGRPSKHWYNIKTNQHITDNLLRQRGFDQLFGTNYGKLTNNEQLMRGAGFVEVYDCGQSTYIWNRIK